MANTQSTREVKNYYRVTVSTAVFKSIICIIFVILKELLI